WPALSGPATFANQKDETVVPAPPGFSRQSCQSPVTTWREGREHLHLLSGQLAGLLHPLQELRLIEFAFFDVEVADFFHLGRDRRHGIERRAAKKRDLDELRVAV